MWFASTPWHACVALCTTSPLHPRSRPVYNSLCHCGLTDIRHSLRRSLEPAFNGTTQQCDQQPCWSLATVVMFVVRLTHGRWQPATVDGVQSELRDSPTSQLCLALHFQQFTMWSHVLHPAGAWQRHCRHRLHASQLCLFFGSSVCSYLLGASSVCSTLGLHLCALHIYMTKYFCTFTCLRCHPLLLYAVVSLCVCASCAMIPASRFGFRGLFSSLCGMCFTGFAQYCLRDLVVL